MKPTVLIVRGAARNRRRYNYRLHEGFFEQAFAELGYNVVHYGEVARGTEPSPYCRVRDINDVVKECQASFCLGIELDPPRYLSQVKHVPRVSYVCDIHRLTSAELIRGSDLLLVRAKRFEDTIRLLPGGRDIKHVVWLPFSVDEDVIKRVPEPVNRLPKVFFAGGYRREPWPVRRDAMYALQKVGLLSDKSTMEIGRRYLGDDYFAMLKTCLMGLACSTRWKLNPAKHVEIPACGTVLFTDGSPGMDRLLPKELYFTYTPNDIVSTVQSIVSDPVRLAEVKEMGKASAEYVMKYHTNRVRAWELWDILVMTGIVDKTSKNFWCDHVDP